jgi:hypothetical protein
MPGINGTSIMPQPAIAKLNTTGIRIFFMDLVP